jgi:hypothetical protein
MSSLREERVLGWGGCESCMAWHGRDGLGGVPKGWSLQIWN